MSIWLVTYDYEHDGWNGREWSTEDIEYSIDRGYFLSKDEADEWVEGEKKRRIEESRVKNEDDLARKNAIAEKSHAERDERDEIRRGEYNALVAMGFTPSFEKPKDHVPFKPFTSKFNEDVVLRGMRWDVIEIEPHKKEES